MGFDVTLFFLVFVAVAGVGFGFVAFGGSLGAAGPAFLLSAFVAGVFLALVPAALLAFVAGGAVASLVVPAASSSPSFLSFLTRKWTFFGMLGFGAGACSFGSSFSDGVASVEVFDRF